MPPRVVLTTALLAAAAAVVAVGQAQQAPAAPAANPLDNVPPQMPFDIPYGAPISLARAQSAIAAAVGEARKHDWKLVVAVVDSGGNLVALERMDGAQLGSIQIAEHKARASAQFRRETKAWESAIQEKGFNYVMTLDGVIGSRGGLPLIEGGKLIGAIGCSGGTGSQDEVACKAAVATIK
jgi:glc operon protein GlcG